MGMSREKQDIASCGSVIPSTIGTFDFILQSRLVNFHSRTTSDLPPAFVTKSHWNIATSLHLQYCPCQLPAPQQGEL